MGRTGAARGGWGLRGAAWGSCGTGHGHGGLLTSFTGFSVTHGVQVKVLARLLADVHEGRMQGRTFGNFTLAPVTGRVGERLLEPPPPPPPHLPAAPACSLAADRVGKCAAAGVFWSPGPAAPPKVRPWPWSKRKASGSFFLGRFIGGWSLMNRLIL